MSRLIPSGWQRTGLGIAIFSLVSVHGFVPSKRAAADISVMEVASAAAPDSKLKTKKADPAIRAAISKGYGNLPLSFEKNEGQVDNAIKYLSKGNGYTLFLTSTEIVLSVRRCPAKGKDQTSKITAEAEAPKPTFSNVIRLKPVGANPSPKITGLDELPGKSNYFIGNDPAKWRTNVSNFAKVKIEDVYPGIDLVYYGCQRQLEYDWIVAPGADPKVIKFAVEGEVDLRVDGQGDLVLDDKGDLRLKRPFIYQHRVGKCSEVAGKYDLLGKGEVGFQLGKYDASQPLVIDPVLSYSTYLGGRDNDYAKEIAADSSGNAYVAGLTYSIDFPTANSFQASHGGYTDVFVAKLNPSGNAMIYSTYIGGSNSDSADGIATDPFGNAYVTGSTSSGDFPMANPFQAIHGGYTDVFVVKLNPLGNALSFSTYLGGRMYEHGDAIAVDSLGNACVTGDTYSTDFPTANAYQASNHGSYDAFVTKLNALGNVLLYSTYLGGSNSDSADGIAVDSAGNTYVTGTTSSTDFPMANAYQSSNSGANDAFVTKLNASGSTLLYSTYLGGTVGDGAYGIAVDSLGNAYITGYTSSGDFPTKNPFQASYGGVNDAFVAKLNASANALFYSTYLGGSDNDFGKGIAVDPSGCAYVAGGTGSTNFPTANAYQASNHGSDDAFVTKLNELGNVLLYSTYLGGGSSDSANAIAVNSAGNAFVTGASSSIDFPIANACQPRNSGAYDAFVTKIGFSAVVSGATLISPSGVIVTQTPSYAWNAVSTASWYLLWVNDSRGSGKIQTWYTAEQAGCASGIGICSVTPAIALALGSCQWWIQTWNDAGYGPWSDCMNFSVSVGGIPGKATLISPSGSVSTATPTYIWNAVSNATWYQVWVNDGSATGKVKQWYTAAQVGCASGTGTCSVTPATVLAPGSATWWIQTYNDSGYGPWSDPLSFTVPGTGGTPGAATLVSPSGTISTKSPTFTWNAVPTATWYLLWVDDAATKGKVQQWYTAVQAGCGSGTGTCSVTPATTLASGNAQWWIQTWNDAGYGPWSDGMQFTVTVSGIRYLR